MTPECVQRTGGVFIGRELPKNYVGIIVSGTVNKVRRGGGREHGVLALVLHERSETSPRHHGACHHQHGNHAARAPRSVVCSVAPRACTLRVVSLPPRNTGMSAEPLRGAS